MANSKFTATSVVSSENTTGNAATATKLQTARTINGVTFDGTANISTPSYSLPAATSSTLGGVKPDGTTITNSSGAIGVAYGTTAGTAAQGNDSRITGAVQNGGSLGTPASGNLANCTFPTLNQSTSGTAANLSGTPALPNGTTATTQSAGDNSTKLATTAYADRKPAQTAGTWSPTWAGSFTVVNGTGGQTTAGTYTVIGDVVHFEVTITVTGTCTTANIAGSGRFDYPPGFTPARNSAAVTAQGPTGNAIGAGNNGSVYAGLVYPPSWAASNNNITISGWYLLN